MPLKPGETFKLVRKLIPGDGQLQVLAIARHVLGQQTHSCRVTVTDPSGPITAAYVTVYSKGEEYASATTKSDGAVEFGLPPGEYRVRTRGPGRKDTFRQLNVSASVSLDVKMAAPGYVNATITDDNDQPIPAKVEFKGRNGTRDPYYGPDTYEFAVQNLRYTHNGVFRLPIAPGDYDVIISHGPEYDAVFKSISVKQDEEFLLTAKLRHSVDTTGWVSSDYHSHSTPSGDNTSSQKGRVLNLLAEHIEFAPCTEHNRISSYMSHIRELDALQLMATCSGMEVTGKPLPVNHHNVFPLVLKSRTQDGGGPPTDLDPVAQIERIALWDSGSDKLIQQDHPNLVQIFGDRDEDGKPDEGFAKMFGFMDVVEVHPPGMIFSRPNAEEGDWKNTMFRWMQLLNQGYRIPGVVNTDAHYNYHGSGWLRNYVRSSTDDPSEIDTMEMVRASERGNLVMTNGPFLSVSANSGGRSAIAGDDLVAAKNRVRLHVRVQCPNWLDINRVQVFVNGRPVPHLSFTRSANSEMFSTDTVKFDQKISVDVSADAHLIVATAGEGLNLGPVYGADRGKAMPVAVANPIFVDVGGNGFQANGDLLDASLPGK